MRNWPWIVGGPADGSPVDWRLTRMMAAPSPSLDDEADEPLFEYEAVKYEIVRGVAVRFMLPRNQSPEERVRAALGAIVAAAFRMVDAEGTGDVVGQ